MSMTSHTLGLRHQLGGYREHRPVDTLVPVAESVWTHEALPARTPPGGGVHRVLPDPAMNLAFRCRRGADGRAVNPRLVVIGPKIRPYLFRFRPGEEIAAVKVKLEWARPLLGLDPSEHVDREDDVTGVLAEGTRLLGELSSTHSADEAGAVLAGAVLSCLHRVTTTPTISTHALDVVRHTTGRVRIEVVARHLGVSLRQLRRAVRAETPLSLKSYARITRLNHAMAMADHGARRCSDDCPDERAGHPSDPAPAE